MFIMTSGGLQSEEYRYDIAGATSTSCEECSSMLYQVIIITFVIKLPQDTTIQRETVSGNQSVFTIGLHNVHRR